MKYILGDILKRDEYKKKKELALNQLNEVRQEFMVCANKVEKKKDDELLKCVQDYYVASKQHANNIARTYNSNDINIEVNRFNYNNNVFNFEDTSKIGSDNIEYNGNSNLDNINDPFNANNDDSNNDNNTKKSKKKRKNGKKNNDNNNDSDSPNPFDESNPFGLSDDEANNDRNKSIDSDPFKQNSSDPFNDINNASITLDKPPSKTKVKQNGNNNSSNNNNSNNNDVNADDLFDFFQ